VPPVRLGRFLCGAVAGAVAVASGAAATGATGRECLCDRRPTVGKLWLLIVSAGVDVVVSTAPVDVVVSAAPTEVVDAALVVTVAAGALGLTTGAPIVGPAAGMSAASASSGPPSTGEASAVPVRPVPATAVNARRRIQRRCARATRPDGTDGALRAAVVADLVARGALASLRLRDV
jgi:hypothetical protein